MWGARPAPSVTETEAPGAASAWAAPAAPEAPVDPAESVARANAWTSGSWGSATIAGELRRLQAERDTAFALYQANPTPENSEAVAAINAQMSTLGGGLGGMQKQIDFLKARQQEALARGDTAAVDAIRNEIHALYAAAANTSAVAYEGQFTGVQDTTPVNEEEQWLPSLYEE
jgi:hypothetical protein